MVHVVRGSKQWKMTAVHEATVCQMVHVVIAVNLQKLQSLLDLNRGWCFSIALDAANKHRSYLIDVHVRVCVKASVKNFYLLAILWMESKQESSTLMSFKSS